MWIAIRVSIDLTSGCWMIGASNWTRCDRILARLAEGSLGDADRLRRDTEARVVHQVEHGAEALAAPCRAGSASAWSNSITQVGEPWMPILVSTPGTRMPLRRPVGQDRRAEHQAEAVGGPLRLVVGRGVARQDEVHVGAAVGDEDLLAVDEVAAVLLA